MCASRKGRDRTGMFLAEGVRTVAELVAWNPGSIDSLLVNSDSRQAPAVAQLIEAAEMAEVACEMLASDQYVAIAETETSQGVVALARQQHIRVSDLLAKDPQFLVVSDNIQDPGNLGALIRIADAVGADSFVASQGSADLHNPKTVRAAMGSLFHLTHSKGASIQEICAALSNAGIELIAADAGGATSYLDVKYRRPLAVVFGNEGAGITPDVLRFATRVNIPMPGTAESLNVAVAAGVMLYEILRQWRGTD